MEIHNHGNTTITQKYGAFDLLNKLYSNSLFYTKKEMNFESYSKF